MPRTRRLLIPGCYYHVISRGVAHLPVFRATADYQYYLSLVEKYKAEFPFDLFHYCLMPNHIHFLVQVGRTCFSEFMKKLNLAYFHYRHNQYDSDGYTWQGRFKSQFVGTDQYFIQCGKYIELNPVRAKIVKSPERYIFSSSRFYTTGKPDKLITVDPYFAWLGDTDIVRRESYSQLLISDLIKDSYTKTVWGTDKQRYNINRKIQRRIKSIVG